MTRPLPRDPADDPDRLRDGTVAAQATGLAACGSRPETIAAMLFDGPARPCPRAGLARALEAAETGGAARRALEALCALRERIGDRPAQVAEIAAGLGDDRALALQALKAIAAQDLNHSDLAPLAILAAGGPRPATPRHRRVTVDPSALPESFQADLARLRAADPGAVFVGPAKTLLRDIEREICGLCWAAERAGITPGFHDAAIDAYFASLVERDLSPQTILNALHRLARFARATGREFRQAREIPYWTRRNSRRRKTKYDTLDRLGLKRADLLEGARAALLCAGSPVTAFERVDAFNEAAFYALLHEFPARRLDASRLRLGVSAIRLVAGWRFDFVISKTGEPVAVTLPARASPFLDAAVLRGADPDAFDALYRSLHGAPLFRHLDGAAATPETLSWWFHRRFGIGPHIARTLLYDDLAGESGGLHAAAVLCGHVGTASADEYLSPAGWRALSRRGHKRFMQALLTDIRVHRSAAAGVNGAIKSGQYGVTP